MIIKKRRYFSRFKLAADFKYVVLGHHAFVQSYSGVTQEEGCSGLGQPNGFASPECEKEKVHLDLPSSLLLHLRQKIVFKRCTIAK
jgi:hypothetical protein